MEGETEISLICFPTQTQSMNVLTTKCISTLAHSNLDEGNKHYTSQAGCRGVAKLMPFSRAVF